VVDNWAADAVALSWGRVIGSLVDLSRRSRGSDWYRGLTNVLSHSALGAWRGRFWLAGFGEWLGVGECVLGGDGFGLCVLVGLPGEHAEGVALEPVVVESFAGVVVVDTSVGGFG
jgi:hypothetical protein